MGDEKSSASDESGDASRALYALISLSMRSRIFSSESRTSESFKISSSNGGTGFTGDDCRESVLLLGFHSGVLAGDEEAVLVEEDDRGRVPCTPLLLPWCPGVRLPRLTADWKSDVSERLADSRLPRTSSDLHLWRGEGDWDIGILLRGGERGVMTTEGGSSDESSASSEHVFSPNFITFLGEYRRWRRRKSGPPRQISASEISEELSAELGRPPFPRCRRDEGVHSSLLLPREDVLSSGELSRDRSKDLRREGGDVGTLEERDDEDVPDEKGLKRIVKRKYLHRFKICQKTS